jgi:hypothetical protein
MSVFADVEQFVREHAACGGLTPTAMPRPGGQGFLLTLTCLCGAAFERSVSPDEARQPLPAFPRAPRAAAPAPTTTPPTAATSGPKPAPAAPPAPPVEAKPRPRPSIELEAAMQEALAAEESAPTPAAPPASTPAPSPAAPPAPTAPVASPAPAPGAPVAPGPRSRPTPARLDLDTTIRSALKQQADLTLPAPAAPRRGSRGRAVWLVLFMLAGLGAAGVIYVAGGPEGLGSQLGGSAPARPIDPQRAALEGIVKSLRDLHAVATSTTSVSVYSTRVTAIKAEAERFVASSPVGPNRTRVREALDIHLLAASAWRAKSLDQKDAWESVGLDATIDLCPQLRAVADFAPPRENASRAQTRGAAVASALPLVWECANERIAALEQVLAGR